MPPHSPEPLAVPPLRALSAGSQLQRIQATASAAEPHKRGAASLPVVDSFPPASVAPSPPAVATASSFVSPSPSAASSWPAAASPMGGAGCVYLTGDRGCVARKRSREDKDCDERKPGAPKHPGGSGGAEQEQRGESRLSFQIFVKTLDGETITLNVEEHDIVGDVKRLLVDRLQRPVQTMKLIFAGKVLEDGRRLEEYNVAKDSTLHMVQKGRVTAPPPEESQGEEQDGGADLSAAVSTAMPTAATGVARRAAPSLRVSVNGEPEFDWSDGWAVVENLDVRAAQLWYRRFRQGATFQEWKNGNKLTYLLNRSQDFFAQVGGGPSHTLYSTHDTVSLIPDLVCSNTLYFGAGGRSPNQGHGQYSLGRGKRVAVCATMPARPGPTAAGSTRRPATSERPTTGERLGRRLCPRVPQHCFCDETLDSQSMPMPMSMSMSM